MFEQLFSQPEPEKTEHEKTGPERTEKKGQIFDEVARRLAQRRGSSRSVLKKTVGNSSKNGTPDIISPQKREESGFDQISPPQRKSSSKITVSRLAIGQSTKVPNRP